MSTLATARSQTDAWAVPPAMAGHLFTLAYGASFVPDRVALALGTG